MRKRLLRILAIGAAVFVLLAALLHTPPARRLAADRIFDLIERKFGLAVSVESLRYDLLTLRASARGLTVKAKDRQDLPPFIRADRIEIDVPWSLLFGGELRIQEISASGLDVVIERGPDGISNGPGPVSGPAARGPAPASAPEAAAAASLPEFRVDRLVLDGLTVTYREPGRGLSLRSPALLVLVEWSGQSRHSFRIESQAPGVLKFGDGARLSPSLAASGRLDREAVEIRELELETEASRLTISGRVDRLLDPIFSLDLAAEADARDLRPFISGSPRLEGRASLSAALDGPWPSPRIHARLGGRLKDPGLEAEAGFEAEARWDDGELTLSSLRLDTAGGTVNAEAVLRPSDGAGGNELRAELRGLDIAVLSALSNKVPPLSATVSGRIDASWRRLERKGFNGRAELSFAGPRPARRTGRPAFPVSGGLTVSVDEDGAEFSTTGLFIAGLGLDADIVLANDRLSGRFTVEALDLPGLCSKLLPAVGAGGLRCLGGGARASGSLSGTIGSPRAEARLEAGDVVFDGLGRWNLAAEAVLADGSIGLREVRLASGPAELRASGAVGLGPGRAISVDFGASGFPLELLSTFFSLGTPLRGRLELDGKLEGLRPFPGLGFRARLAGIEYAGLRFDEIRLEGRVEDRKLGFDIAVPAPAASIHGALELVPPRGFEASLRLAGTPLQDILRAFGALPEARAAGSVTLEAGLKGQAGAFERMDVAGFATVRAEEILLPGPLPDVRDLELEMILDEEGLTVKPFSLRLAGSSLEAEGTIPRSFFFGSPAGGQLGTANEARLSVRAEDLDLSSLAAALAVDLPKGLSGRAGFEIKMAAAAPRLDALGVSADIRSLEFGSRGLSFSLSAPAAVRLSGGRLSVDGLALTGPGGSVRLGGAWDLRGGEAPSLRIDGDLDLKAAQPVIDMAAVSGRCRFDLRIGGSLDDPSISGQLSLREVRLETNEPNLSLSGLAGDIRLERNQVLLSGLRGNLNGGRVELGGEVAFEKLVLGRARLDLTADGVSLDFPGDLRSVVAARISLASDGKRHRLGGDVRLLAADYREPFNIESRLFRLLRSRGRADVLAERLPFLEDLSFALSFETVQPARLDNDLIEARVRADLKLTGSPYAPGLQGRISVVDGGEVHLARDTYQIVQAAITFVEADQIVPDIDLTAQTRRAGYLIELKVLGTPDDLTATLVSEPPLPESDIVALLLTGQRLEYASSRILPAVGLQAADYLEGVLWGRIEQLAEKTLGLDTVRIDTSLIAAQEDPESRITVGQDLTRNLELIYSQGLRETEERTFILNYRPIESLNLRAVKQDNDAYLFGAMHEIRFGLKRERTEPVIAGTKGPVIERIDIEGELGLPPATVRKRLKLKAGRRFDFFALQKDLGRLEALYARHGFLESTVDYRKTDTDGGAVLAYRIDPGPRVQLTLTGAPVSGALAARARRLWHEGTFEGQRVADVRRLLLDELYRHGRYQARIAFESSRPSPDSKIVLVRISPGPAFDRLAFRFDGLPASHEGLLRELLVRPELIRLLFTRPGRLSDDMELVLRKDGFLDAAVDEPRLAFRADEGLAEATFPVRPGPRYVIGRLAFEGRSRLESSVVAAAAGISEGELFKPDALDPARERVERLYKAEGFVNARVESRFEARSGEGTVDLVFEIEENDRAVIDSVAISGNEITTDGTIGRELEFGPGAVVDARAFSQAQRRLYRLGVFQSIEIDAEPSPEAEVRNERGAPPTPYDVEVRVEEISPYYLRYGGQYDTETGLGGTIEFVRRNFLGRAIDTGAAVQADFREQAARAYLRSPYFLGARIDTSLSAFAGRIEEPAFTSGRLGASFQQQVRFRGSYVVSWNYTFERIRNLLNGVPLPYEPYDIGRLSLAVTRDKRASLFDSVKGSFISLAAEYAGRALASDFSYVRFLGQYFMYVPLGKSLTYAAAVRLGLGEGLGGDLVLSERFFAGGGSSIRGFGYREVGPTDPITGLPAGGNAVLIVNQELRFPIYKALGGTLFVDLGNVYPTVSGFDPFRVRKTAGAGLRVNLGFILGRLDLAFKLDRRSGESLCRLHFSLGQAF